MDAVPITALAGHAGAESKKTLMVKTVPACAVMSRVTVVLLPAPAPEGTYRKLAGLAQPGGCRLGPAPRLIALASTDVTGGTATRLASEGGTTMVR